MEASLSGQDSRFEADQVLSLIRCPTTILVGGWNNGGVMSENSRRRLADDLPAARIQDLPELGHDILSFAYEIYRRKLFELIWRQEAR
jgi:hypothetical protein